MGDDGKLRDVVTGATVEPPPRSRTALVIGAGPSGLFAAELLAGAGLAVTVVDQMPSVGRKLLMAGRGGLNLTHSEPLVGFVTRYGESAHWMAPALADFPPSALVNWAEALGIETFVGSSGRVFPKQMKASPLLRAWLRRLERAGVGFVLGQRFVGWSHGPSPRFEAVDRWGGQNAPFLAGCPAVVILALGGASWPRLGSDGAWWPLLADRGVGISEFAASNAGVLVAWSPYLVERFAGAPLKSIAIAGAGVSVTGEAVISRYGLEGGAIYALNAAIRAGLQFGPVRVEIDFRPSMSDARLVERLSRPRGKQSFANFIRKVIGLTPAQIALLRECAPGLDQQPAQEIARAIKCVPVMVSGMAGLERAISSVGGVRLDAVDEGQMLKSIPGVFVAGEMLDWDAPTGGYLLQGCFATGRRAALGALRWLDRHASAVS